MVLGLVIPAVLLLHYDVPEALAQTTSIDGFYKLFGSVPAGTMITWWLLAPAGFIDNMALQRVFAAKDEKSAKGNITAAFLLMIIFGLILMFIGIMARFILPAGSDPASAMLNLSQLVLPKGMLGLLVAAFAGVAVSTASSTLLVCSSTLEQDVYSVLRNTGKEKPASSLLVNRLFVVLVGLIALVLALKVPSVTQILMYGYSVYVPGLLLPVIARFFPLEAFRPRHVAHHCLRRTHRCHSHSDGGTFPRLPGRPDRLRHSFLHRTLERQAAGGSPLTTPVVPISR